MSFSKATLQEVLTKPFSLALAPGFFRYFAYCGLMHALQEREFLTNVQTIAGSSAGALVAGFYASGMQPHEMRG